MSTENEIKKKKIIKNKFKNKLNNVTDNHHHHHRFKVRFSMLARVGLLSPTAFGSQMYKTQPLLKAPGFNPVLPGKPI